MTKARNPERTFFVSLGISILLHAAVIAIYVPVTSPARSPSAAGEFKMIRASVVKTPVKVSVTPIEPVKSLNDAVTVNEKPAELPKNADLPPAVPIEAVIGDSNTTGQTNDTKSGMGTGGLDFLPFYKVDVRPEYLKKAVLEYPMQAQRLGKEGSVILEADIDAYGKLVDVRVIKKAGFGFDEAALKMIRESIFSPAFAAGRPVPVRMRFTISFKLKG